MGEIKLSEIVYCQNCGAADGETHQHLLTRIDFKSFGDPNPLDAFLVYKVSQTERGTLCQYCQRHSGGIQRYDSQTGETIPVK